MIITVFAAVYWNIIISTIFLLDHEAHCGLNIRCSANLCSLYSHSFVRWKWRKFTNPIAAFVYRLMYFGFLFCCCKNGDKFSSWTDEASGSSISLVEHFKCIVSYRFVLLFSKCFELIRLFVEYPFIVEFSSGSILNWAPIVDCDFVRNVILNHF